MRPVTHPAASRSSSVAISVSTPNALAIGRVMNSLVEVAMATQSPASRCERTSARARSPSAGAICSRMKRSSTAACSATGRVRQGRVANST